MTNKDAIRWLASIKKDLGNPRRECLGYYTQAIDEICELLKEQEAIEPREQEETRTWTVCGNCSQHLISKWLWCPYCGRKVKWNDSII